MRVLLDAGIVQIDEPRPVVEDTSEHHILPRGAVAVVALDLADIFLYGLLRGSEDTFQKKAVE